MNEEYLAPLSNSLPPGFEIHEFHAEDVEALKEFTDKNIGLNYYTVAELRENQKRKVKDGISASFLLWKGETIHGLRLSYPPMNWHHGKGSNLRPDLWGYDIKDVAYFQSLFVSAEVQGHGLGPLLSIQSIANLKKMGAKAILTHSWKESPNNSSVKYLERLGFKALVEHPNYWIDVDYVCPRDGKPCRCTAVEMLLELK